MLTIAMAKGRILKEALELFSRAGIPVSDSLNEDSRKLVITMPEAGFSLFLAKPMDVPTYVEYGVADLGIVGKDVLLEQERDVYELLDLRISPCRMAVAGKPDWRPGLYPRVATKYPRIAEKYFKEKGQQVEVILLNGSVELAPIIGLADRIVDIVSTGQTLRENGLVELEPICTVTSRMIANRASYRLKSEPISALMNALSKVIGECVRR
ncbi:MULTISPECIES: ATP phosphoribosyltransferase [Thermoactinomyces]|jgi:ATP phosphoribosyltransferase|uniref:ATP phosphoribosyltransferase n=1 Tax=Thermoactinomyces daqus TaxID=1329516 RepID=A0A7W2AHA4_9BACL|nr:MULTISPECIES: ATP phosphoribosyltransferase [Thermoactinomyces]MBA4543027.1 ATP phosphoribosyltransferase [Thermoactinomyces daqus]MBH8598688.1 ATP phosphoribosyltransferase [Thermoactinomyces sp. CICC 10523]MBH8605053.1 ATP phosphoribosyltransferase [Thermoactinomyces sp. CICC 10522]MBH8606309.1 ATP phosphoribosyltransferase [Thermoactinomyces sp. CICC 10521]